MRTLFIAVALALGVASAQSASDIDKIAEWASYSPEAHKLKLAGAVAKIFALTNGAEFYCQGVSYSNPQELRLVFCNIPGRQEKLVVRTDSKFGLYWLIKDGSIIKTVYYGSFPYESKGPLVAKTVPNDLYDDGYKKAVKFFLDQATTSRK